MNATFGGVDCCDSKHNLQRFCDQTGRARIIPEFTPDRNPQNLGRKVPNVLGHYTTILTLH